jgi:hypothetical protein
VRVVEAAARNIRAISFDVERCIDSAGAPKGGRACCYLGVCLCYLTPAMAKRCYDELSPVRAATPGRKR